MRAALSGPERRILEEMVRSDRPRLSPEQLARKFHAITGRKVSRRSIRHVEARGGYEPAGLRDHASHLTPPQAELLTVLVRDAKPHYCRCEIARQFEAATGRPITAKAVRKRCRALGLPAYRNGRHAGGLIGGEKRTPRCEVERSAELRRGPHQGRGRTSADRPAYAEG